MIEIWKEIKGYDNLFVSNKGNVKLTERTYVNCKGQKRTYKEKLLKKSQTGKYYKQNRGYFAVKTNYGLLKVHRLVAVAFLHNKDNLQQVNHKDGDSLNNNVENQHHSKRNRELFTSNYVGVRFRKDRNCYSAELKYNKKRYRKSGFKTQELANEYLTSLKNELCL